MIQNSNVENYWLNKLSGPVKSGFPYDHKRIDTGRDFSHVYKFRCEGDLFHKLMKLSNHSFPRLQMVLTAGLISLLAKYSGNDDIITGTTIYKQDVEAEFINTVLPLRNRLHEHMTFKELLLQVRETITGADENQNYPVEKLLQKLKIPYAKNDDFPLFDIVILLENIQDRNYVRDIHPNMLFSFLQTGDAVAGRVEYNSFLYRTETVARIITHFQLLLQTVLADIELPLAGINILTPEEQKQLVDTFNQTRAPYPGDKTISELLEAQVAKTPDHTAAVHNDKHLAYKELDDRAVRLAKRLEKMGVKADKIVGIMAGRSLELLTAITGILKAGAAFLPLDPITPENRVKYILKDSRMDVLLIQEHLLEQNSFITGFYARENIIFFAGTDHSSHPLPQPGIQSQAGPVHMAYIIYTSGTTGKPKGTVINQQGLVNYLCWAAKHYITNGHGNFPLFTSIAFDLTITSLFTPLITGNAVIVYESEDGAKETLIEKIIADNRCDVVKITPSHLKLIRDKEVKRSRIRRFISGGEDLETELVKDIITHFNGTVEVINEYGPTEAVVGCMGHVFNAREDTGKRVPLGVPADNVQIFILDKGMQPVPVGVTGDLYISGDGIARGYLNRPGLTAEKFIIRHLSRHENSKKLYKTGDLARWTTANTLEFLGRVDHQLKIRGYRIELGEIENCLSFSPLVKTSAVVAHEDKDGEKRLTAYVVPFEEPPDRLKSDLKAYLKESLPDYMIPAAIIFLKEIPLTANGKIDRKKLPGFTYNDRAVHTPPRDEIEKKLVELWSANLDIPGAGIGIDADYFELGGHSLKATVLLNVLHKEFAVKLPLLEIFKHPTIRGLGEYIKGMAKENYEAINPAPEKEYYELSPAQKRLYILQQMEPRGCTYNIPVYRWLTGPLNSAGLEHVFLKLIERHESLRTSFAMVDGKPMQKVHRVVPFAIEKFAAPPGRREDIIKNFPAPFDLTQAPLLRVALIKETGQKHLLMIEMHHIITDGLSMDLLVKEFMIIYAGEALSPLKLQYKDYAEWQAGNAQKEHHKKQEQYWLSRFEEEPPVLDLPTDFKRPSLKNFAGNRLNGTLANKETQWLKKLALNEGATFYMVLLAIYNIFLAKLSNLEDIIVGTPAAGRRHVDLEPIIGMFVNTLALRNYPSREKKFTDFLSEVKADTLNAFENQDYPYENLIEAIGLKIDAGRNPLFDTMFVFQNEAIKEIDIPGLKLAPYSDEHKIAKFDLTLIAEDVDGKLFLTFEYSTQLFKAETIARFMRYFENTAREVIENKEKRILACEIITGEEKKWILEDFNNSDAIYPHDQTIRELFAGQVEKTPDVPAVTGPSVLAVHESTHQLTYRALDEKAGRLASILQDKGVGADDIVGIMVGRSLEMIIGIWAILKAGGAYLPISPDYPAERIHYILRDSHAKILINDTKSRNKTFEIPDPKSGANPDEHDQNFAIPVVLNFEDLNPGFVSNFVLRAANLNPVNLAYLIYTSGSTGKPKGVLVKHDGVTNAIYWRKREYGLGVNDRVLQLFSFVFDGFVTSLFTPLISGSCAVLLSEAEVTDILAIKRIIVAKRITHFISVPSLYRSLLASCLPGDLAPLRILTLAGEAVTPELLAASRQLMPPLKIINEYGATENTVVATLYKNTPAEIAETGILIGKPVANTKIFILDRGDRLSPIGVSGEINIAGVGVARGYLNNPELTDQKFVIRRLVIRHSSFDMGHPNAPCPMIHDYLYKTGDLGRWLPDGNIEFIGRKDRQVKIRGFRIELGEIENQLLKNKAIKDAVVLVSGTESEKQLCAYIVSAEALTLKKLRTQLAGQLPDYMVPAHFRQIEKIPLTPSGKVDRRALALYGAQLNTGTPYAAPENDTQAKIIAIWQKVLKRDKIGIHDNYFDLGGHSLDILKINEHLKKTFPVDIPIPYMFRYPTVASLETFLNKKDVPGRTQELNTETHHHFSKAAPRKMEIAVIGMAGKFPGAKDLAEFWKNIAQGKETISFFTDDELQENNIPVELLHDPCYVKAAGILDDIGYFDAAFFGYTPKEAEIMDPQFRLFHECIWHALEDAGYYPGEYEGLIGLYAGSAPNSEWQARAIMSGKHNDVGHFAANQLMDKGFLTLRISYKLNLKGPSLELNTACSSSLVAIHTACMAIRNGECDLALAGGVTVTHLEKKGYLYREGMILSPDGHCRPFDAGAKGTLSSDGAGVVVLKRLEDAISSRDHIYAVIKGTAINNDGLMKAGFTAPGVEGQAAVIRMALQMAAVEPESINYIETHGTGTELGDPIEVEALKLAFNSDKKTFCALGSVKSNIGHTDIASGVAGFLKTILALKHKLMPPSLHVITPNPTIDFENSPFYINTVLSEWPEGKNPRRAGVSSFGMGGTNAHVIVEEVEEVKKNTENMGTHGPAQLILLSAKTPTVLDRMTGNLAGFLKQNPRVNLADAAYTLTVGRQPFKYRGMFVCSSAAEAIAILSTPNDRKVRSSFVEQNNRQIVFMFSGLGGQYENMGFGLYREEPVFRAEMDRCFQILKPLMGIELKEILYPPAGSTAVPGRINLPEIVQPIIFIFGYALAQLLIDWGIKPHAMIGYSFGEYIAACMAGVFSLEDALKLVVNRAKLIKQTAPGGMLSVPLGRDELKPLLNEDLAICIDNGPSCVVGGKEEAVAAFEKQMKENKVIGMRLQTARAVHSQTMSSILKEFARIIGELKLNQPKIPYISNVTGHWSTASEVTDPAYWVKHLSQTVQFAAGIKELVKNKHNLFIEIGPGRDISALVQRHLDNNPAQKMIHTVRHPQKKSADRPFLLDKLGRLWLWGVDINWRQFYAGQERYRLSLPTYPFERQRYWLNPVNTARMLQGETHHDSVPPSIPDISEWFYFPAWKRSLPEPIKNKADQNKVAVDRQNCLVFVADSSLGNLLVKHLKETYRDVIVVQTGSSFQRIADHFFTLDPREYRHYENLINRLRTREQLPGKIIHMWNVTGEAEYAAAEQHSTGAFEKVQETGFFSLLYLARALGKQNFSHDIRLHVLTDHVQDVLGNEPLHAGKATMLGLLKVIPQEYAGIRCQSIDIELPLPGSWAEEKLIRALLDEFSADAAGMGTEVAYRNQRKWVQVFEPLHLEAPAPGQLQLKIRQKGVFLITGGLGKIGLMFAELLVKHAGARLILTGRSPLPSGNESFKIKKWQELEAMGGEIIYRRADAADLEQMRSVVKEARERFGTINGIIHAAGVTEGQSMKLIQDLTSENCRIQFQTKVFGLLVLHELFKEQPLDFCWLLSSISCVLGGLGFGAYAPANRFMDAFVKMHNHNQQRAHYAPWFVLNWDGMDPGRSMDIFARIFTLTDTDQLIVSRDGNLPGRIDRWIKLAGLKETGTFPAVEFPPSHPRPDLTSPYAAPRNETEKTIASICEHLFGFAGIGIEDDFLELGGDSLKANTLITRIHQELGVNIPLAEIFAKPTIKEISESVALRSRVEKNTYLAIEPVEEKEFYELSSAQKRLYIVQQLEAVNIAYNLPYLMLLEGKMDRPKLAETFNRLLKRHESLRTSFEMIHNEPVQRIHHELAFNIEYFDCGRDTRAGLPLEEEKIINAFIRPFDLSTAPLLRVGLIKLQDNRHILMIDLHHIISDAFTLEIFITEFQALYSGENLPALKLQYKDFSAWQNAQLKNEALKKQEAFWLKELGDDVPVLNLPIDFPRPRVRNYEGKTIPFGFSPEETNALKEIARMEGSTLFITLLSIYNLFLSKLCSQDDIILGSPIHGRRHAELYSIIGFFINYLALRNDVPAQAAFPIFLQNVKTRTLDAFDNQDYQFELLVDKLTVKRDLDRNPIFNVSFALTENIWEHSNNLPGKELAGMTVKPYPYTYKTAKFDLSLSGIESAGKLLFSCEYSSRLFKEETIVKMVGYFKQIAARIIANPHEKIADIEIIPAETKRAMLEYFNEDLNEAWPLKPIQVSLADAFRKYPHHTAIEYGTSRLTYAELEQKAALIARCLAAHNIEKESFIGVYSEDKITIISALIGILNRGCIFVPFDTQLPVKRIGHMIRGINIRIILTDTAHKNMLSTVAAGVMNILVSDDNTCPHFTGAAENKIKEISYELADKVYVYFTSGSTGIPNAIMGKNKSLVQFLQWEIATFSIVETYRVSQLTAVGFDAFLRDVLIPLLVGGITCIPGHHGPGGALDSVNLVDWLDSRRINLIHCVPSLFPLINPDGLTAEKYTHLKYILFSGEPIKPIELKKWYGIFGDRIQLVNYYGATETTMIKTFHLIRGSDSAGGRVPAGRPITGSRALVLDKNMNPCDRGITGEIYIRTAYSTYGYLNNPGLNAQRFLKNPFSGAKDDIIYKTGDLGRELANGEIEVLGRMDRQVKIRGIRIELAYIENCLLKHSQVEELTVLNREAKNGENYLCAYIVFKKTTASPITGTTPAAPELREFLSKELPDYMIPAYFIALDEIPLMPNGKIDRGALPEPGINANEGYIPPQDELQKKLVKMWAEILGKDELQVSQLQTSIGIDDNFFDLGAHSLKVMTLIARIHKELQVQMPLAEIFKAPHIRGMATFIEQTMPSRQDRVEPVEKKEYYPLSSVQRRLYVLQQLDDRLGTSYNMPSLWQLQGELNEEKLQEVFRQLIRRHESLRTSFLIVHDEPVQRVTEESAGMNEAWGRADVAPHDLKNNITHLVRPFDLSRAPLLRVNVLKIQPQTSLLMVDMHHIICDGVSTGIFVNDFMRLYAGDNLPPLTLQYKDFCQWHNRRADQELNNGQADFWLKRLDGELPVLQLPTDYPRPTVPDYAGHTLDFEMTPEETAALNNLAREQDVTLFMLLLSNYTVFLAKLSGQEDIIVGTPTAGRKHTDLTGIIGMFVNTLVLRNFPMGRKTFTGFLKEIKENTINAIENEDYPYEDLVGQLAVERDTGRNPLFDAMFALQNMETTPVAIPGLNVSAYPFEQGIARFDLTLKTSEIDGHLALNLEYSTRLFKAETARRWPDFFKRIISTIINNHEKLLIGEIEIISQAEKQQIVSAFNDTAADYPRAKTIPQLFQAQVENSPDRIAVAACTVSLSYQESNRQAGRLAAVLIQKGVVADDIIGISMGRSLEMIIGIMGILKAGGAYLPIEPNYPPVRIDYMLTDSGAKWLVSTNEKEVVKVKRWAGERIFLDEISPYPKSPAYHLPFLNPVLPGPTNLAYIIYTSGSTGKSKGVMVEHRSIVNILMALQREYPLEKTGTYLLKTSYIFDVSVAELFGWFLAGGRLAVLKSGDEKDPQVIIAAIWQRQVTHINFVPSMFNAFIEYLNEENKRRLSSLKFIFLAGEALLPGLVDKFRALNTGITLENIYGPTESTVYSSKYSLSGWNSPESIPIGKPLPNIKLYILNKYHYLQPLGIAGELFIGGDGLARGYLNNPALTTEKFIDFHHSAFDIHHSILYRTGDLGRWLTDGNIEYLGRIDHQIKIRGYRVELGEIENRLLKHDQVKEATVVIKEDETGDKNLVAYFVAGQELGGTELQDHLLNDLPGYMIPAYFVQLSQLPLTASGKIDRRALPGPGTKKSAGYVAPRDEIEKKLVGIWSELLGRDAGQALELQATIGIDDNFFHRGGHSLKATILVNKIQKEFGVTISIQNLFRFPSIAAVAGIIKTSVQTNFEEIGTLPEQPYYEMSYAQKRLWYIYRRTPLDTAFNLPAKSTFHEKIDAENVKKTLEQLVIRHESLRTTFKEYGEEPVQVIESRETAPAKLNFSVLDLSSLAENEREQQRERLLKEEWSYIFNLEKGPLFRARLVKCGEEEYDFILNIHHILADGWSIEVLKKEFSQVYEAYKKGFGHDLRPLNIQYKDYAAWQNKLLANEEKMKQAKEFWKNYLNDTIPALQLPYDFPAQPFDAKKSSAYCFIITGELSEKLRLFARVQDASLFMVLLAAFNILLSQITFQDTIRVGIPAAARQHLSLQNCVGLFVNTLILQTKVNSRETFSDFMGRFRADTFNVLEYQGYPLEIIFAELKIKYPEITAFFNMLNLDSSAREHLTHFESYHSDEVQETKFPIHCYVREYQNGIQVRCHYYRNLFRPGSIEKFMQVYIRILENLAASPLKQIHELAKKTRKYSLYKE